MDSIVKKSIIRGIIGGFILLAFYFGVLTLANSFSHSVSQFNLLWYWILTLVIGFSIQVGLWFYVHSKIKENKVKGITGEVAATGGISAGSMIACCAHHLVDVLPILGLSALFLFLAEYQVFFLALGVLSNIIGVIFMLEIMKKSSLYKENSFVSRFFNFDIKKVKHGAIAGALVILIFLFFGIKDDISINKKNTAVASNPAVNNQQNSVVQPINLSSRSNSGGNLSIEITPTNFSFTEPLKFQVAFNTHQGDLDFDLTKQAFLIDDQNNKYQPLEWQGGQGGHHLSGKLIFPSLKEMTKKIKPVINNVYGIKERVFEWDLE